MEVVIMMEKGEFCPLIKRKCMKDKCICFEKEKSIFAKNGVKYFCNAFIRFNSGACVKLIVFNKNKEVKKL